MKRVVYLPLDERPCNTVYPSLLAEMTDLKLIQPPREMLGSKKAPADVPAVGDWLCQEAETADYLIVSIDQLVYGGIVPSRLHRLTEEACLERLALLRRIRRRHPSVVLYAFNLIMRAPAYSDSEEEPDYYALYGSELCERGKLLDKAQTGLSEEDRRRLEELAAFLPAEVVAEFDGRRQINAAVNEAAIDLVREGVVDHLTIPLDDNAEYGFTSMEQRRLRRKVVLHKLTDAVSIYPGADEVGCTLFARAFAHALGYRPRFYARFSSMRGPQVIPKYEDRSLMESLKAQLCEAGVTPADAVDDADAVLMVHAPAVDGPLAAETFDVFDDRHRSYGSEIHLPSFADVMEAYMDRGKVVSLADVAVSNGSDFVLMDLLADRGLLPRLAAYAGWNTCGNSLGTVIAHTVVESYYAGDGRERDSEARRQAGQRCLAYRLIDDWAYQAIVRQELAGRLAPSLQAPSGDPSAAVKEAEAIVSESLDAFVGQTLNPLFRRLYELADVRLPWSRLFEVSFRLSERPGEIGQLIRVMAASADAAEAEIVLLKREDGVWWEEGRFAGFVGGRGLAADKREGDGKTPLGLHPLEFAFGKEADPGTRLPYIQMKEGDVWVDDPDSPLYNTLQRLPSQGRWRSAETMLRSDDLYDRGIVIGWNRPEPKAGRGSAIFIHASDAPTAGCLGLDRETLALLLRWLDSAMNPAVSFEIGR